MDKIDMHTRTKRRRQTNTHAQLANMLITKGVCRGRWLRNDCFEQAFFFSIVAWFFFRWPFARIPVSYRGFAMSHALCRWFGRAENLDNIIVFCIWVEKHLADTTVCALGCQKSRNMFWDVLSLWWAKAKTHGICSVCLGWDMPKKAYEQPCFVHRVQTTLQQYTYHNLWKGGAEQT